MKSIFLLVHDVCAVRVILCGGWLGCARNRMSPFCTNEIDSSSASSHGSALPSTAFEIEYTRAAVPPDPVARPVPFSPVNEKAEPEAAATVKNRPLIWPWAVPVM